MVSVAPTKSIAAAKPPVSFIRRLRISGRRDDRRRRAGFQRRLALGGVDVRDDGADAVKRAGQVDGGEADPAGADDQQRVFRIDRRRLSSAL